MSFEDPPARIAPADAAAFADLAAGWRAAYEGYFVPVATTPEDLARHIGRGGIDLGRSLVAVAAGRVVGLSLAAVEADQGWIGGFGVAAPFRRQGLASRLIGAHCAALEASGVRAIRLEVIDRNPARRLYGRAGFRERRRLLSFEWAAYAPGEAALRAPAPGELASILAPDWAAADPTWRRRPAAVLRRLEGEGGEALVLPDGRGYAVFQRQAGALAIVDAGAADAVAAGRLLAGLAGFAPGARLRLVDEPEESALCGALQAAGVAPFITQYEMRRPAGGEV